MNKRRNLNRIVIAIDTNMASDPTLGRQSQGGQDILPSHGNGPK